MHARRILILSLFFLFIILSVKEVVSTDIGFDLKAGEYIFANHRVPVYDPFSYTASHQRYIDSHWLFQLLLFSIYSFSGVSGIILFKTAVLLATFSVLFKIGYQKKYFVTSLFVTLLCFLAVNERSFVRSEIMTFLFLAVYLYILHQYKYKRTKWIVLLPLLQIVWANMHGPFILGVFLLSAYCFSELILSKVRLPFRPDDEKMIAGKSYIDLCAMTLLSIFACFITPYGLDGLLYSLHQYKEIGANADLAVKNVVEAIPPFGRYNPASLQSIFFFKVLILVSVSSFLFNFRRLKLTYLLVYCAFLYLALLANRNIALFAIVAMPVTVININEALVRIMPLIRLFFRRVKLFARIGYGLFFVSFLGFVIVFSFDVISTRYYIRKGELNRFGFGFSDLHFPEGAMAFIKKNNIQGRIFNSSSLGSCLIREFYPDKKVFIDGRLDVYDNDFVSAYASSLSDKSIFSVLAQYYRINYVFLENWLPLSSLLYNNKDWVLVYLDGLTVIYVRNVPVNQAIINKYRLDLSDLERNAKEGVLEGPQRGLKNIPLFESAKLAVFDLNLGDFFKKAGFYELSKYEFRQVLNSKLYLDKAYNGLGMVYFAMDKADQAKEYLDKAVHVNPRFAFGYFNLGTLYTKLGMLDEAIKCFQKALSIHSNIADAHWNLALIYNNKGESRKALREMKIAIALDPQYLGIYESIGDDYSAQKKFNEALAAYSNLSLKDHPYLYKKLALVYAYLGNDIKAAELLKQYLKAYPDDTALKP